MSGRLSLSQGAALTTYPTVMVSGQLLLKTAAPRDASYGPLFAGIAGFLLNGYFFVALVLYAAQTVLWVWILSFVLLFSRAFPFPAFAFAERLTTPLVIGIVPILCVAG